MARLQNFGFTTGSGKQFPLADTYILFSHPQPSPTPKLSVVHTQAPFPIYGRYNSSFLQLVLVFTQPHSHCILSKSPQPQRMATPPDYCALKQHLPV